MNFTIGLIAGFFDCLGALRIRDFFYCLPMYSGRRGDGFDFVTDRYCVASGVMTDDDQTEK